MGESIVDASNKEDKIGEMGCSSNAALQVSVSVSFGRFENDSLSWEKWSSFSPNKYLEEVEKCATPGSVAKKKAYFEQHYKKISARKAEESKSFNSDDGDKQETSLVIHNEECLNSSVQEKIDSRVESQEKEEIEGSSMEETVPDEAVLVAKQDVEELPERSARDLESTPKIKDENDKLGHSEKITPVNKERNDSRIKKKPTSPVTKTPQFSSTPTTSSASKTPSKTATTLSHSLPKTKNSSVGETKKVAPTSLHMSLSLGPSGSDPASLASTRKSLIMEKMGDKDIVKRAFKTFQSNYNQLKPSTQEQSPAMKQVPAKGREPRFSTLTTPQKENGGSSRVGSMEKKNAKAAPSYFGLKSDERAERRKEITKKLEEKSNGREAERKHLQTKSKDNRDAEIKKLRQSLNFKAAHLPGFYHGQKTSKSPLDKIGTKSDIHR